MRKWRPARIRACVVCTLLGVKTPTHCSFRQRVFAQSKAENTAVSIDERHRSDSKQTTTWPRARRRSGPAIAVPLEGTAETTQDYLSVLNLARREFSYCPFWNTSDLPSSNPNCVSCDFDSRERGEPPARIYQCTRAVVGTEQRELGDYYVSA